MSDLQEIGRAHPGAGQELGQLMAMRETVRGPWAALAPSETRPIGRAGGRELCNRRLHDRPAQRRTTQRRVEDDRRFPAAGTVNVQTMSADVDEASGSNRRAGHLRSPASHQITGAGNCPPSLCRGVSRATSLGEASPQRFAEAGKADWPV